MRTITGLSDNVRIAVFASGSGSNAEKIIQYFAGSQVEVALIATNKSDAHVLRRAEKYDVSTAILDRVSFYQTDSIANLLRSLEIRWIILAGFLWLVPENLIRAFVGRIINIHPALLPKYGGKGMYGMNVHRAVASSGDQVSGISIHFVNERYDEGQIIFQKSCRLPEGATPEAIQQEVQKLEHHYYPRVIERLITNKDLSGLVE